MVVANFSDSIRSITEFNFGTTSAVLRYNLRMLTNEEWLNNLGYIGILF